MITIIKTKRLKELKEAERKLKLVKMTTGTYEQLKEKRGLLVRVINDTDLQIQKINNTFSTLKNVNGRNLREYKKTKKAK